MATLPSEFQELAAELIDDEFAAFRRPLVIYGAGVFDPVTETFLNGSQFNRLAIRQKLTYNEYQRQDIQVTDFAVVYVNYDGNDVVPSVSQQVTYDGVQCQIIDVMQDAADAGIKLILRAL